MKKIITIMVMLIVLSGCVMTKQNGKETAEKVKETAKKALEAAPACLGGWFMNPW